MTDYTYLGGDFDLPAKKILLDIEDDDAFVAACATNSAMRDICAGEDIWRERLNRYYPEMIQFKDELTLTLKEFYPIVSLLDKINKVSRRGTNPETEKLLVRLFQYVLKYKFDYTSFFSFILTKFNKISPFLFFKLLSIEMIKKNDIQRFLNYQVSYKLQRGVIYDILKKYASPKTTYEILNTNIANFFSFMQGEKVSQSYMKELSEYFFEYVRPIDYNLFLSHLIEHSYGKVVDWFIQSNKITNISEILTKYIINKDLETNGSLIDAILIYMFSRRISPDFRILLPTNTILKDRNFFIREGDYDFDYYDNDVDTDTEEDSDEDNTAPKLPLEKFEVEAYMNTVNHNTLLHIINRSVLSNIFPSEDVLAEIPPIVEKEYPEFMPKIYDILKLQN